MVDLCGRAISVAIGKSHCGSVQGDGSREGQEGDAGRDGQDLMVQFGLGLRWVFGHSQARLLGRVRAAMAGDRLAFTYGPVGGTAGGTGHSRR